MRARLATEEDQDTARLIRHLRRARHRGCLTLSELSAVCRWKSPRAIWQIRRNSDAMVRTVTRRALRARDERERVSALLELRGVAIPMASAVLTMLNPRRYGVIDIRVWQLLHARGYVSGNRGGTGLTVAHWLEFLAVLRGLSATVGVTARLAEKTLFEIHRERQLGRLYRRTPEILCGSRQ